METPKFEGMPLKQKMEHFREKQTQLRIMEKDFREKQGIYQSELALAFGPQPGKDLSIVDLYFMLNSD